MSYFHRRVDRRACRLCCWVGRVVIFLFVVLIAYTAAVVASGGLFTRSSPYSHRIPALNGGAREPAILGPSELHPAPLFRFPNYQPPRHAS